MGEPYKLPQTQKGDALNTKPNKTKRENHTQKNYFLLLTYRKMAKTPQLTPKEKKELQDRFSKMDANPHTDYKIIAFELAKDYRRLAKKCKGLENKIGELEEEKGELEEEIGELEEEIDRLNALN